MSHLLHHILYSLFVAKTAAVAEWLGRRTP